MSIDLTLALALFLGATWISLLNSIVTITRERPTEHTLIAAAFVHFVVLLYFLLAASVLYGKTIKKVLGHEWSRLLRLEEILIVTWPAAVAAAMIGFLGTKVAGFITPILLAIPFVVLAFFLLKWAKRTRHLLFFIATPVLFVPYLLVMSLFWSGVSIETNQKYYKHGDVAIITARSEGYLLNPGIKQIEIWSSPPKVYAVSQGMGTDYFRVTQPITDDMAAEATAIRPILIRVVFDPQASWFSREEYAKIDIIP